MRTFTTELPAAPPAQVLAECYAAFRRAADLRVAFASEDGRLVPELTTPAGVRRLRPSEVFDLLDGPGWPRSG